MGRQEHQARPGQAREAWTQARCVHLQDFLMEHEVWSLLRAPSTVIIHRPNSCLVRVSRTCSCIAGCLNTQTPAQPMFMFMFM